MKKLAASFCLTSLVAIGTFFFTQLQFCWGWFGAGSLLSVDLSEKGFFQWLCGTALSMLVMPSIMIGLCIGYLKEHFKGTKLWYFCASLWPSILFSLLLSVCLLEELFKDGLKEFSPPDLSEFKDSETVYLFGITVILALASAMFASRLFRALSVRTKPWKILLPSLALITLTPIVYIVDGFNFEPGLADGVIMFLAAAVSAYLCNVGKWDSAMVSAGLCAIPFLIFSVYNLLFDLFLLSCNDSSCVVSFVSALLICGSSLLCTISGAGVGFVARKMWQKRLQAV